jgi:hypothetical protein
MLVWGSKGEVADLGPQHSQHCPTCEKERAFKLMLQYKVRHIWYVFKWVTDKQYAVVCEVCQRGQQLVAKTVEEKLGKSPIPFSSRWSWAFLVAIVAGVFVFGAVENGKRDDRTQALMAAPMASDMYVLNVASLLKSPESSYMYGVMRVRSVKGDLVEFDAPSVTYNKVSGATKDVRSGKAAGAGYFVPSPVVLSRGDIVDLQRKGAIHSIERD